MGQTEQQQHGLSPASLPWSPCIPRCQVSTTSAIPLIHLLADTSPVIALGQLWCLSMTLKKSRVSWKPSAAFRQHKSSGFRQTGTAQAPRGLAALLSCQASILEKRLLLISDLPSPSSRGQRGKDAAAAEMQEAAAASCSSPVAQEPLHSAGSEMC